MASAVQTTSPTANAALSMARAGFPVFPCGQNKHPLVKWKDAATIDLESVTAFWQQHPTAMIGLPTGKSSGVFVVDLDIDKSTGEAIGEQTLQEMGLGDLLATCPTVETPSGGKHLYFRHPGDGFGITAKKIGPGVDTRGDGGYVVAAGSVNSQGAYRFTRGALDLEQLPELPQAIKDALAPRAQSSGNGFVVDFSSRPEWTKAQAELAEVEEMLSHIDPDAGGYDQWVTILMAVHDHTSGGGDGLALANQWSARGAKYQPGEVARKWASFSPGGGVGIGTICELARQNGADLSEIARRNRGSLARPMMNAPTAATSDGTPRPNTPDEVDLSHDALARDMGAKGWDADARHVATWGKWLFWTGTHWQADDRLNHMTRTRDYLRQRADDLTAWAERKTDADVQSWAKTQARNLRSKNTVAAIETLARSNLASVARPTDFDADRMLLGTPSGVVDLRTGTLRDARRSDMITKQTTAAPAPSGTEPDLWLRFLNEIFNGDADIIGFMQRAAGYALTGSTIEHKLLFLYGTGRNGKSVFLNTLFDLWGDYARRASSATFLNSQTERHPTDLAGLQGARLVAASELPRGKTWDESVIKDLTGGDTMTARFMRGDFFDFEPQLTLMIAGNNMPSFRGVDEAIRARVVLVPFTVYFPPDKRDKGLPDKLKAEAPSILRWAIDGALQLQERGLDVPDSVAAASAEYFDDEDIVGQFLLDETTSEAGAFTGAAKLHQRFDQWAERQGLDRWTQLTVVKEVRMRGFSDGKSNGQRGLRGIRLNPTTWS